MLEERRYSLGMKKISTYSKFLANAAYSFVSKSLFNFASSLKLQNSAASSSISNSKINDVIARNPMQVTEAEKDRVDIFAKKVSQFAEFREPNFVIAST